MNAKETDAEWQRLQLTLRQGERRSRQRRVEKTRTMRQQVETLSRVLFVLPLVDDTDIMWDALLDDEMKYTFEYVRRLLPASREIQRLLHERTLLVQLIREHELMMRAVREQIEAERPRERPINDWKSSVQRWRALVRIHFRPWTIDQCKHEIGKATNEMNQFLLSKDRQTTGLSFMGWQDSRRIDPNSSRFQFTLEKTFNGFDLDYYVASSWRVYTEGSVFGDIVICKRAKLDFEVLQELSPTCCLIRFVESYENLPIFVHRVYLIARIETSDGIVQFMRSVRISEIERVINRPNDSWAADFFWMRWVVLDSEKPRSSSDFCVSLGGTMSLEDLRYLQYWLFELLGAIVRSEAWSTKRPLLQF